MVTRCDWADSSPLMQAYHDHEWGKPLHDDHALFELMCMETYQAGLSWQTVLNKRAAFNEDFKGYDVAVVAEMSPEDWEPFLQDERIIRHRGKLAATVNNAQAFQRIQAAFGSFATYWWAFVDNQTQMNDVPTMTAVPGKTDLSVAIAKDLKKRGFKFMGPVATYAYMQATGMVNDHLNDCEFKN
ncbi:DNA-3-methyladenine glycosylase I [Furfurilactobacillus sp. WILCCON 0119]|uniref:DNA-3-methyladenine glycosylase I n=1 Tax=Furfurilactobacillus entadae TaxID=2922307 RepID=UPI0035EE1204